MKFITSSSEYAEGVLHKGRSVIELYKTRAVTLRLLWSPKRRRKTEEFFFVPVKDDNIKGKKHCIALNYIHKFMSTERPASQTSSYLLKAIKIILSPCPTEIFDQYAIITRLDINFCR